MSVIVILYKEHNNIILYCTFFFLFVKDIKIDFGKILPIFEILTVSTFNIYKCSNFPANLCGTKQLWFLLFFTIRIWETIERNPWFNIISILKVNICPGRCGSVGWMSFPTPKDHRFYSAQGTCQVVGSAPSRGMYRRQLTNVSLASTFLSFSPSHFLPL